MSDESQAMRLHLSLDYLDVDALAQVMASMPPRGEDGKLRPIGLQDAVRWAIHETAKRSK